MEIKDIIEKLEKEIKTLEFYRKKGMEAGNETMERRNSIAESEVQRILEWIKSNGKSNN